MPVQAGTVPDTGGAPHLSTINMEEPSLPSSEQNHHMVAVRSSEFQLNASTGSVQDARALAEALHDARPSWRISIDDRDAIFSRDGRIVDFIDDISRRVGTR
jgi:hypothetical protein